MEEAKGEGEERSSNKGRGKEAVRLQSRTAGWGKTWELVCGSSVLLLINRRVNSLKLKLVCKLICNYLIQIYLCLVQISGREMFYFNPDLAAADEFEEGDEAFESYNLEEDDGQNSVEVLNFPYCGISFKIVVWSSLSFLSLGTGSKASTAWSCLFTSV